MQNQTHFLHSFDERNDYACKNCTKTTNQRLFFADSNAQQKKIYTDIYKMLKKKTSLLKFYDKY